MARRLRVPHAIVFAVSTTTIGIAAVPSCSDDECIPCVRDLSVGDGGVGSADAAPCPACLPKDGVCPVGCMPDGFT